MTQNESSKHSAEYNELAEQVGNLRYDALVEFLSHLSDKLANDAGADLKRGRAKLATTLFAASVFTRKLRDTINIAWKISEPFMKEKDDD